MGLTSRPLLKSCASLGFLILGFLFLKEGLKIVCISGPHETRTHLWFQDLEHYLWSRTSVNKAQRKVNSDLGGMAGGGPGSFLGWLTACEVGVA